MTGVSGVMSIADGGGRAREELRAVSAGCGALECGARGGRVVRRRGIDAGARAVSRPSHSIFSVRATVAARCITV